MNILFLLLPYALEQLTYWYAVARVQKKNAATEKHRHSGYTWYLYLWDALIFGGLGVAGWQLFHHAALTGLDGVGLGVFALGTGIRMAALLALGRRYFGGIGVWAEDVHIVVDTGIYRALRHPLHLGTTVQIMGLACFVYGLTAWGAVGAAGMVGISWAILLYRNRVEDLYLLKQLAGYAPYYHRAWDVIDLVWRKEAA